MPNSRAYPINTLKLIWHFNVRVLINKFRVIDLIVHSCSCVLFKSAQRIGSGDSHISVYLYCCSMSFCIRLGQSSYYDGVLLNNKICLPANSHKFSCLYTSLHGRSLPLVKVHASGEDALVDSRDLKQRSVETLFYFITDM